MRINENILSQARTADVLAFFEKYNGFTFAHRGGEYRCQQHPSLAVKVDRLSWYWHSKNVDGYGVLDYLIKVEHMTFPQALEAAADATLTAAPPTPRNRDWSTQQPKALVLPKKSELPLRLYDYLHNKRGIDSVIIYALIQKEMLYEDKRGNVVFVGYDEHNKPRFASLRGTHGDCSFRGDCPGSDKRFGFTMMASEPSERLYIFESAIDSMSHASLENYFEFDNDEWKAHHRLSLAGTTDTAIPFFLNQHETVKELVFCLDNDAAGREAADNMVKKYAQKGYCTRLEFSHGKDFNEDLQGVSRPRKR